MQRSYQGKHPVVDREAFVAPTAVIIGQVELGPFSSLWFNTVARGDVAPIIIGQGTNIQDGSIAHGDHDIPVVVGEYVTVGHNCVLHGCKIGDRALIGMSATILNNAEIGEDSIVGAGSLVTTGTVIPSRTLAIGSPAKVVRELTPGDMDRIKLFTEAYLKKAQEYKEMFSHRD